MIQFPNKKYSIIYADPPWSYRDGKCGGGVNKQYKTMGIKEICTLPVKDIADRDCILFMWTTYPMLKEALQVIEAWGFTYKSIAFQWIKQNKSGNGYFFGLGRWTRGNTEPCLLAVKGKPACIQSSEKTQSETRRSTGKNNRPYGRFAPYRIIRKRKGFQLGFMGR